MRSKRVHADAKPVAGLVGVTTVADNGRNFLFSSKDVHLATVPSRRRVGG